MKDRRYFLKSTIGVIGMCVPFSSPVSLFMARKAKDENRPVGPTRSGITWRRNIFCQFENEGLKAAVEKCARETDCTVFYGTNPGCDIHAIPAFVMIVDRDVVGHDLWRENVEFCDSCGDDVPCFIVDDVKDLPMPKTKYVYQFDMNDKATIPTIVKTIREMKMEMNRRLPDLFIQLPRR